MIHGAVKCVGVLETKAVYLLCVTLKTVIFKKSSSPSNLFFNEPFINIQ